MRYLIVICTVLLTAAACGGDYTKIDVPTTGTINQIFFFNDQLGWAVTSDAEVLSTFDAGKTWRKQKVGERNIRDIHFHNRAGYLTGDKGLLMKSTNGGGTWEDMSLGLKYNFVGIGAVNDSVAIVCGTDQNSVSKTKGVVFETRDGGKTWKKHAYKLGHGYTDLATYGDRKVFLLASKKAFHSISEGSRYFHGGYEGDRLGLGFDFENDWGFLVGVKGLLGYSFDHGRNWRLIDIDSTSGYAKTNFYAVEMFDKYSGVAVGDHGAIMYLYDDGDRQTFENCGWDINLRSVFITGEKVFFGGEKGLMFYRERFPRHEGN